ncbi:iron transporter [Saccharibacter sp. 17.LH.SD]|uniref:IucA/IucC family protein n=1 Tax=Saccharibacter sp. 17.LH.SD TaxID=2689393 RepID=UPI001369371F|nr:IucA/IucC family protein [Saccharibacter sp. 17.LH.SD]MXV44409.1 iron transporter [Saccharibacter sp. 17.LH.SD]
MNLFSFLPNASSDPMSLAAERYESECLVNCFLREYAWPHHANIIEAAQADIIPPPLRGNAPYLLFLTLSDGVACCGVERVSALKRCHINSPVFLKRKEQLHWDVLSLMELAQALLQTLAPHGTHDEFLEQLNNNHSNIVLFLTSWDQRQGHPHDDSLIMSEQGLVWGHSLHPTPKSRQGVPQEALLQASPETGAHFPLFWFRVALHLVKQQGEDQNAILRFLSEEDDLYPCHPWEVERILQDPVIQQAQKEGVIVPVGLRGKEVFSTSSVRTVCHPELDEHLKFSFHVRLTNCVRKNAWYELESAVLLTEILRPHFKAISREIPGFSVLEEPSATTLDFSSYGDVQAMRHLTESFGILYRKSIPLSERLMTKPHVALALFSPTASLDRHPYCLSLLQQVGLSEGVTLQQAARRWVTRYVDLLAGGILQAHIIHGIIMEPHLQNVLVGTDDRGLPCRVWIRDMEGTKLSRSYWEESLTSLTSLDVRESLLYDDEKSQYRTQYCLFVNHLAEALFHIAWAADMDEKTLWADVEEVLHHHHYQLTQRGYDTAWLSALLAGRPLSAKGNLLTRLHHVADKNADIVSIASPFPVRHAA